MRVRRIAVLIDGGFFLKRLPYLVAPQFRTTPQQVADSARHLCKRHVQRLAHLDPDQDGDGHWLDHVYRLFYYDAEPYQGVSHHPILNRRVEFGKSDVARFRRELFAELKGKRKFALRLAHVTKEREWQISPRLTKSLLKTRNWIDAMERSVLDRGPASPPDDIARRELQNIVSCWREIAEDDVSFGLRQKGVDMRMGLDIASIT